MHLLDQKHKQIQSLDRQTSDRNNSKNSRSLSKISLGSLGYEVAFCEKHKEDK